MLDTIKPLSFRARVRQEAQEQRRLRAAHQAIPKSLKKYARLSGLALIVVPGLGEVLFFFIFQDSGFISLTYSLLFVVLMMFGVIQLITGRHLISGR